MRLAIVVCLALLLGSPLFGCAHETRTVTTTETLECPEAASYEDELDRECTEVRTETTVVKERERDSACHGVVSCSFAMVGHVVALPFRIVGLVLGAVF